MSFGVFNSVAFSNLSGLAVAPLASVAVLREDTGAVATLFADVDGAVPLANPFLADALGRFSFYAAGIDKGYRVTVTKVAEVTVLRNVPIGNAQYLDASAFISAAGLTAHIADLANPHAVTPAQVGISAFMQTVNDDANAPAARATLGILEALIIAASDEATALTVGTNKVRVRMPYALTLTDVRASLSTPQTSGTIFTVDVNEAGVSLLSTKLTIDNTEKTSTTAVAPPVISDAALADDAEITVDIDQIGDGTAKGLKVTLIGRKTA